MKEEFSTIKYIPIILIVIGYVNLHSFYISFGVNIYNYIDSLELILSFAPILYELSFMALSTILGLSLNAIFRKSETTDNKNTSSEGSKIKIIDRDFISKAHWTEYLYELFSAITKRGHLYLIVLWSIAIFFIMYNYEPERLTNISESMLAAIYFLFLFMFLNTWISIEMHFGLKDINRVMVLILIVSFTLTVYVISFNKIKAKNIMLGNPKYEMIMDTADGEIKTDSTTHFIGSTREYQFLYDRINKKVIIFNGSNIKRLTVTQVRSGI
jgi:hypothetical protein